MLDPIPYEAPEEVHAEDIDVVDEENVTSNTATTSKKEESDNQSISKESSNTPENPNDDAFDIDETGQAKLF